VAWGNSLPILAGDILYSHALALISRLPHPRVPQVFADAIRRTCEGEVRQLLRSRDVTISQEDCLVIAREKTASLWSAACEVGAILSGGSGRSVEMLRSYGLSLGTAFQIADDCIDLVGSEAESGKTLGTDLRSGRYTLPIAHLIAASPQSGRNLLESDPGDFAEYAGRVRRGLLEHGSLASAARSASDLALEAGAALQQLPASPARDGLTALAEHIIGRLTDTLAKAGVRH
jgi:octaprenyl-diphosphate synthase